MTPVFEVHDLTATYRKEPVIWGVDFKVFGGTLAAIVGPNGAGKSTLLKASVDLVPKLSGWARFFDRPLAEVRDRVGYMPQREEVDWDFPVNVRDVVMMGRYGRLGLFRRPGPADHASVDRALEIVGLTELASAQISNLSGGQQQRTFLARALAQDADLYLMDEPFAGVDAATERAIMSVLGEMRRTGKTVIAVHHDLGTVREYFDQVALLNLRLIAWGPTEKVLTPESLRATYGGKLTILSDVAHQVQKEST